MTSREIKFRAWHKGYNKFVQGWLIYHDGTICESGRDFEDGINTNNIEL